MTLRAGFLALAAATMVLAACSGQGSAPQASSGSLTSPGATDATPPSDTSNRGPKAGGDNASATTETEAITGFVGFTSPNGNIGCYIDSTGLRCDIGERDWAPLPRPTDCEFDYGQGISLPVGEMPQFACAGDSALSEDEPLAYGKSISVGTLECDSAETGMTCRDTATMHGFSIAREGYKLF